MLNLKNGERMADEKFDPTVKSSKGGMSSKIIVIGLPLFIIQLVAVYFIVAYLFQSKFESMMQNLNTAENVEHINEPAEELAADGEGEIGADTSNATVIYNVDDLILNPAGTNGQAILLVSLGLGLDSELEKEELQKREVLVRDLIITTLSSKTLEELGIQYRDSLRAELAEKLEKTLGDVKIRKVYFSKYMIQ